jgi:uncharacterized membrane protein (DUF4010 family)
MSAMADELIGVAVAFGVGLMIGVERERAKGQGPDREVAGVRTFMLVALMGALTHWVGAIGVAVGGAFVGLAALAGYRRSQAADPGLTTEVAMLVTFFLGILAMRSAILAAGLSVIVAIVLASKSRMHLFIQTVLWPDELHDLLLLMAAAFVVLPLLPDAAIDPWGAIRPRKTWLLVIAVMAVSTAGYVALRAFGSRRGLALAGLAGGFVSSIATIAAMGDRARSSPQLSAAFASAALASNVGTVVQLAIVLAALSPALLQLAAWPLAAAGLVAVLAAVAANHRALAVPPDEPQLAGKRPFELRNVLGFVAILTTIMLLSAVARHWLGEGSLPWVLAASGLADVHAASASAAQLVASGRVAPGLALTGLCAALASNSAMKCLVAVSKGGRAYAGWVLPGVILMVGAFVLTALLT